MTQEAIFQLILKWVSADVAVRELHLRWLLTYVNLDELNSDWVIKQLDADKVNLYSKSVRSLYFTLHNLHERSFNLQKYQDVYFSLHNKFNNVSTS